VDVLCELFGNSRQAYYQYKKGHMGKEIVENIICSAVNDYRSDDPGIGGFKLYLMLCDLYGRDQMMGRDSFYKLLRRKKLMLKPSKGRCTTNSNHRYHKYKNLIKGLQLDARNQLWVSDITYISLKDDVCYLHLITDAYSHKIIGWCLAPGLHSIYTLNALNQAIKQSGKEILTGLIHHSDRGSQYCCDLYVQTLTDHQIAISMTEDSKPTDNAVAERINGIIKQEWLYKMAKFENIEEAEKKISQIIDFYNTKRPHMSNNMLTPEKAHLSTGVLKKRWKNKVYAPAEARSKDNV
jgi:transposase InsO family protein